VEGFLNAGGFAITYVARDSLDRRVVIKECYPAGLCRRNSAGVRAISTTHQDDFETVVHMFGKEARRLAKLIHPNIVGVRDAFEEHGTAYMALEFVEGRDLADIITHEPERLDPARLRAITMQLLDAVAHVHEAGTLHRDISPDNILLRPDGSPVLIDFGAARDRARRATRALSTLQVVKDGYSPQEFYMQDSEQTAASDLYSLAASLYHAITGAAPACGHERLAMIPEGRADPVKPLFGEVAGYDNAFLHAIDRALSVFARDRLQAVSEWIDILEGRSGARDAEAVAERIRQLVRETNPDIYHLQECTRREAAARAKRIEEARKAEEAARAARLEAIRREWLEDAPDDEPEPQQRGMRRIVPALLPGGRREARSVDAQPSQGQPSEDAASGTKGLDAHPNVAAADGGRPGLGSSLSAVIGAVGRKSA
jgi:serine/threonine protein kinase